MIDGEETVTIPIKNSNSIYGTVFVVMGIAILVSALLFGAHAISGTISVLAITVLLFFEGIRLLTDNTHHKRLHSRFDNMENMIKKLKE